MALVVGGPHNDDSRVILTRPACRGAFKCVFCRLYALSQATFFVDPKLGAWPLWRGLRCPYLLHETSLAAQGPQDGPDQPRQHEGCSTKDLPHGHPLRCCSSACEATTVEIRVVTIGCTCMEQGGGWRRERAASPSTRAADSIARPSSLLLRVVLAMRAAAVTRWWRACGWEGRDCGLTAATSARLVCAVR